MKWQLRRGLLNPPDAPTRGSSWWRAMNERLLYDGCEAHALAFGNPGSPSSPSVAALLQFIRRPTAASWYRAHNMSLVTAYLQHEHLASRGPRGTLLHQSRAGPCSLHPRAGCRAATGARLACPAGRLLGDPRLGITGIFLSLSRVLPDRYPLGEHVTPFVEAEHGFGHLAPAAAFGDAQGFAVADAGGHRDPVEDLHDEPRRLEVDDEVRV
ncbi:hypothetical protein I553_2645 [Mycobacterium xenopi 4042]|uniref:Uncharacterized protein n=1 Tax=Mycobacterium xenopi 4042 TaxID=1299334 RepID=X8CAH3_MYCXE|nr:hypothetical protein I553_2645 [Mycobacterium xenopi 4042]